MTPTPGPRLEPAGIRTDRLEPLVAAIRSVTRVPSDWEHLAKTVASAIQHTLPSAPEVLACVPEAARAGADMGQVVHVEADGSFSVVALITRPGQRTPIHDHITWCAVAVIAGLEEEERFRLRADGRCEVSHRLPTSGPGAVEGFAPPGDIHRLTNVGDVVGISLNVYGTDISRIGSSVRRTYESAAERGAGPA
jgi:3-mercaptopropionate dioxygenase